MQVTRGKTERPRGALLQPEIGCLHAMYRIGGRLRSRDASFGGAAGGIPLFGCERSNLQPGIGFEGQSLAGSLTGAVAS